MEALGGAASVIAVVQIAGKVWSLCWKYYSDAKEAKSDIERLMGMIQTMQSVFQQVEDLAKGPGATKLHASKSLIERIPSEVKQEFDRLENLLEPSNTRSIMRKALRQRLKWPLKKEEVEKTLSLLERHKTHLITAMNCDQM